MNTHDEFVAEAANKLVDRLLEDGPVQKDTGQKVSDQRTLEILQSVEDHFRLPDDITPDECAALDDMFEVDAPTGEVNLTTLGEMELEDLSGVPTEPVEESGQKYRAVFPVTRDMSPIDYVVSDKASESREEEALWHYNRSREHDGLQPLRQLPPGVKFEPVQGDE